MLPNMYYTYESKEYHLTAILKNIFQMTKTSVICYSTFFQDDGILFLFL